MKKDGERGKYSSRPCYIRVRLWYDKGGINKEMYSTSIIDRVVYVCILLNHVIKQPTKSITHPFVNLTLLGSSPASIYHSNSDIYFYGLKLKHLSRVPIRYLYTRSIALV